MKLKTIVTSAVLSLVSSVVLAGQSTDIPVEIDLDLMSANGSMKTARFQEGENAQLGCGTRTFVFPDATTYKWGFCQASNDEFDDNSAFCTTENPELLAEIDSINNNDYVIFRWDVDGICTHIGNSTQSQYIAANKDEDKKVKKDNKGIEE
jgi:hypothetical protein